MGLKLILRGQTWYASGTMRQIGRIFKSTGYSKPDKERAEEWLLRYELDLRTNPNASKKKEELPFTYLLDEYIKSKSQLSNKESNALNIMRKFLGQETIYTTRTNLANYIEQRHAKSATNSIARDVDSRLRAVINYGQKKGWCGPLEWDCSSYRVDDTRTQFLEREQVTTLLDAVPTEYKDFYSILVFQGMRFGQAKALTGQSLQGDYIVYESKKGQKNGLGVTKKTPVMPKVKQILELRIKRFGIKSDLFPEISYSTFRRMHLSLCERIGISDYRIHDNRSTFATNISSALDLTNKETASLLGHSTTKYVDRYKQERDLLKRIKSNQSL